VETYDKLIIKQDFVHQVGLLLRLYWDARSAKCQNFYRCIATSKLHGNCYYKRYVRPWCV